MKAAFEGILGSVRHYLDDVTQFARLDDNQIAAIIYRDEDVGDRIKAAVSWAVQHAQFDFMEFDDSILYSNEDIYEFLCKVAKSAGWLK